MFPIDTVSVPVYCGSVNRHIVVRSILLVFLALALFGPLSGSTISAPAIARLTTTHDVGDFEWSPGGDALYFTRDSVVVSLSTLRKETEADLFRVPINAGPVELIARNARFPAIAPGGNQIAFLSLQPGGSARLRLANLTARTVTDLDTADWGSAPQWLTDGDRLVYSLESFATELAITSASKRAVTPQSVPTSFQESPRGGRLAYAGTDGLHLITASGDTNVFRAEGSRRISPQIAWSRSGGMLAFVVTRDEFDPELWVVGSEGNNPRKLFGGGMEYIAGIEWAADESNLLFTRIPSGSSASSASEIWRISFANLAAAQVTQNREEELNPRYSPNGTEIAFLRDGDLWVAHPEASGRFPASPGSPLNGTAGAEISPSAAIAESLVPSAQLTSPSTIRVKHDQNNTCRNVPVGRIDTIDFETYVKRVVPAEVYSSWPPETLKAQAVAARSYAWFWVLQHLGQEFDVTDSTAYQYMCDTQASSTDSAVDSTRGQYGSYGGNVIFAAYGANNGDPTLNNTWGNPYLIAVDDPVEFGAPVSGNGIGLSQWGAQRWASSPYRWNYQQILLHYYSGVTIELPSGTSSGQGVPIAGMLFPWSNWGITSNRVFLSGNASDDSSTLASVKFVASYYDGSNYQSQDLAPLREGVFWNSVADVSSLPDQAGVNVTPHVIDPAGNEFSGNGVTFALDRTNPVGSVLGPSSTITQTVSLSLAASDEGPGGLAQMAFSNEWVWQGEGQSVTNNSGTVVADAGALNGSALLGRLGSNPAGYWYGPYTSVLPSDRSYRAYFRLKTDNVNTSKEVAMLDVVQNGGSDLLGLKRLRGTDFRSANAYQEFYVDFNFAGAPIQGLEFRVAYRATASIWLDRILLVSYPVSYSTTAKWSLDPGNGLKSVVAKFIDGAGNVSSDAIARIFVGPGPTSTPKPTPTSTPQPSPTKTPILTPEIWLPLIVR